MASRITGRGRSHALLHEEASFTVRASSTAPLRVSIRGNQTIDCQIERDCDSELQVAASSQYVVRFKPSLTGRYKIDARVGTSAVRGSPFEMLVTRNPAPLDPKRCVLKGAEGAEGEGEGPFDSPVEAGTTRTFAILMRDVHDHLMQQQRQHLTVVLRHAALPPHSALGPHSAVSSSVSTLTPTPPQPTPPPSGAEVDASQNGDTLHCSVSPTLAGTYAVAVQSAGSSREHITGSPFRLVVTPSNFSFGNTTVSGSSVVHATTGSTAVAAEGTWSSQPLSPVSAAACFSVTARDRFGNEIDVAAEAEELLFAEPNPVTATVTGAGCPLCAMTGPEAGKGTYVGSFNPGHVQGVFRIRVMLGRRVLPGTPFSLLVIPAGQATRVGPAADTDLLAVGGAPIGADAGSETWGHGPYGSGSIDEPGLATLEARPSEHFSMDPQVHWLGNTTDRISALQANVARIRALCSKVDDDIVEVQGQQMQLARQLKATALTVKKKRWEEADRLDR